MMKLLRKAGAVLLCVTVVCSLAVTALALPASDYAVLNVVYAPNGTPVNTDSNNPVEYKAYKLADAVRAEGAGYTYTLTEAFQDCTIDGVEDLNGDGVADLNDLIGGEKGANGIGREASQTLLNTFRDYINGHSGIEPVQTSETARRAIGAAGEMRDGVAQFTGLTDGLYLIATSAATWLNGTRYTPVSFVVNIPYVFEGVENNYLTATVKFETYTPPDPTPPKKDEPQNPDDPPLDIPDPDVPMDDGPTTEILPDDVPTTDLPELHDPDIELPDDDVPLATLPQTGLLWWPVPLLAAAGVICVGAGAVRRKRDRDA